jgi:anti-sigma regulatory factor (Ser/Thr protein kinase)
MAVSTDHAVRIRRDLEASFYARETAFSNLVGRVPDATLDDVLLIVSELVTNAALHGEGEILVRTNRRRMRFGEVTDEGPGFEPKASQARHHDAHDAGPVHRQPACRGLGCDRRRRARVVQRRTRGGRAACFLGLLNEEDQIRETRRRG